MSDSGGELSEFVQSAVRDQQMISLILARPRKSRPSLTPVPRKLTVRPVTIQKEFRYQWEQQFDRQQTHVNRTAAETEREFHRMFPAVYQEAYLFTGQCDLIARATPQGIVLQKKPPSQLPQVEPGHDRKKSHLIPEGTPCPFLVELDVMTSDGKVKASRQKKFRQINRYLEMVNDIVAELPATGPIRVVDFGCGLSYLTFALHHLLHVLHGRSVELLGIDQNLHVIQRCREIAGQLKLPGMRFQFERILTVSELGNPDLTVSLHACDTATDDALALSVGAGARVILAAPCCQRELFNKLNCPTLNGMFRFGVVQERVAALATDSLRAAALEAVGYRTQLLEFIELEHTPKNLLLRAVKRDESTPAGKDRYRQLKSFFGDPQLATDAIVDGA